MRKLLCTILAVGLLAAGAWAQTTITVPTDQPTVHAAVLAANAGDTVYVLDGIHTFTNTLNIDKAITLEGQSENGVIFDIDTDAGYGIHPSVGGITLKNFTMNVISDGVIRSGYPIHASGTPAVQNGLVVDHVTIQGSGGGIMTERRAGLDIHGYDNVVLTYVTSKDATYGNGIQITGCTNVDVDNCTTMNNAWGSLAIFVSTPLDPDRACDDVYIDASTCSFGENNVYIENQYGLVSTNVVVDGYDYYLTNGEFRAGAEGFIFIKDTLADVQAHALAAFGGFEDATVLQEIATGEYVVDATLGIGMTIQAAIDAASPGDVVNMSAGHFEEQLHITTENLTLAGAGIASTFIEAPDNMPLYYTTSADNYPIVFVDGVLAFAMHDLTVDGLGRGNTNYRFQGIGFWNAGGTLHDLEVNNIMDTPFSGAQHANGVYAYNDTGGPYTITMTDVDVNDFQKTGVALNGAGLTVDLTRVTTPGQGPTGVTAQNGIQIGFGAGGTLTDCSASDIEWTGDTWVASGILLYSPGAVTMDGVTVTNTQASIYDYDGGMILNNSTISGATTSHGVLVSETTAKAGDERLLPPSPCLEEWNGAGKTAVTAVIDGCSVSGTGVSGTGGVVAFCDEALDITVTNTTMTGFDTGLALIETGGVITGSANGNTIFGNVSFGAELYTAAPFDAAFNYWGGDDPNDVVGFTAKAAPIVSPWYDLPIGSMPMTWGVSSNLQSAIDAASPGDVIVVAPGSYAENVTVNKSLTLLGANADAVCGARGAESVISPASGLPVSITADGVVFNGFEVTTAAHQYGIILSGTSNVEVVHNNVHDINSSATPVIANTFGIYYSVPNGEANSDVVIADNCIDNIASSNVTGSSCAAIGVLQSTSTGTLSDLVIARNTITDVNVNTGTWPTGKIAYGMILNTGSSGYLTTTGKIIDAVIEDNVIDGLSGFISTAIGLEGNTENAYVSGNVIANLYGTKTADRSGGGYDLNGIKFESNRYVGTVTVEYNSIDRSTFDHNGTLDRGYAVANYVPVGDAYTGGTTSTAIVTCNWFGTADAGAIADAADLSGAILNKAGAETEFIPFLVSSDINAPDCSGGSSVVTLPAVSGPINCDDTVVVSVDFTPDALTPGLRGYSVTLQATTGVLSFGAGDITISNALDPTDSGADLPQIVDNGDGTFTVDNGILGSTSGLTTPATLFTVEIHPVDTGSGTVDLLDVILRDVDNVGIPTSVAGAAITVDCTPPPAAYDMTAAPGGDEVRLSWNISSDLDVDHYELWRAVWHTGDNTTSAYPEYDDVNGPVLRQADYAGVAGSPEWTMVTDAIAGNATSYNDAGAPRGIYWYELFAVDAAGNVGPQADNYVRATNYFLGDFDADGQVSGTGDLSPFGGVYGNTWPVGTHYPPESFFDIGPTDDFSGLGLPTTDNTVGFEDLMILALNYDTVAKQDRPATPAAVALSWVRLDQDTWALELNEPCEGLLGLNVRAPLPEGVGVTVERGELLDSQSTPAFLATAPDGLDIGVAALGSGFTGQGELLRVTAAGVEELSPAIDARGHDNAAIDVALTMAAADLPTVLALDQNQPNPFNPSTTIKFDLPQRGRVDLMIYALDGSLVRTLVSEVLDPGRHDVAWQGRDDSGRAVASGTYFYRMVADGKTLVRKMTLMK